MLIGSFSPLVKIFQPSWHARLQENPDLIFDESETGWQMRVYRPCGDYPIKWRIPREESNPVLLDWLTGGEDGRLCIETDYTGIVRVNLGARDTGELFAQLELEEDPKVDLRAQLRASMDQAKAASHDRVMRAVEQVYQMLRKQWQSNKESNFGVYQPSITEYMCLHVKQKVMDRKTQIEREHAAKVEQMMAAVERTIVPGGNGAAILP